MLGSLIRSWRRRLHFRDRLPLISGIVRVEPFGFSYFPWSFPLWEKIQDRLDSSRLLEREELTVAATHQLSIEELESMVPADSCYVLAWDDVREIWTYKVDLFTIDMICLNFIRRDESSLEVSEHALGWSDLIEIMTARCPGIPSDWWQQVAFPAFATNTAKIWNGVVPRGSR